MESTTALRLMTVQDVAAMLNVKASWVYGKVASREIPHLYVGRYPRFVREEVIAWLRGGHGQG